MDESDRTAIHEVMEQQTISISKAGISTTLNARASILSAANPLYGRYNPKVSPVENINLPAALLSRFDLMFLILDKASREDDERLARHVTYVHMNNRHPQSDFELVEPNILRLVRSFCFAVLAHLQPTRRHYIAEARRIRPTVPQHVSSYIVDSYVRLRKISKGEAEQNKSHTYTSARTLLGVLRLAQALARLRQSGTVEIPDVDEALRLMECSKESLLDDGDKEVETDRSPVSRIFRLIKQMARSGQEPRKQPKAIGRGRDMDVDSDSEDEVNQLSIVDIRRKVLSAGFTEVQLTETIAQVSIREITELLLTY